MNTGIPLPLTRFNTLFPGQMGVPGTDEETGLRQHPTGTVRYVDPNYPGAHDRRDGTDPTSPLLTVQAAIDLCQDHQGDVIIVGANSAWEFAKGGSGAADAEYTTIISEEVTLDKAGVKLIGVSPSTIGVTWSPASNGGTCITVTAIDCVIEGFVFTEDTFTGCNAIYCEWDGVTLFGENMTVRNCTFSDTVDIGVQLEFAWYCDIYNNKFVECDTRGIWVDTAGSGSAFNNILGNWFTDCAIAMTLHDTDDSLVSGNRIYNSNAQGGGVATDEGIDTTGGARNEVSDNFFSCLLPVPANGDYDDLNTAAATDAWINNHCMNGDAVTNPT